MPALPVLRPREVIAILSALGFREARQRLHELRHSAASQTVMSGDGPPLSGRLLGHNRHCTTAGYAHLADAHLVEAVEKVGAIIATAMASQRPRPITLRQWLPQRSGARSTSKKLHQSGATVSPV